MVRLLLILSLLLQPAAWLSPACAAAPPPAPAPAHACCCCSAQDPDPVGGCACEAAPRHDPEKLPDQPAPPQAAKPAIKLPVEAPIVDATIGTSRISTGAPRRWISHRFDRPIWCVWHT